MRVSRLFAAAAAVLLVPWGLAAPPATAVKAVGQVVVVQAMPGTSVNIAIDGESMKKGVGVGTVLGPYRLTAGKHKVTFTDEAGKVKESSSVTVKSGSSSDVVLHRPASTNGDPVVNVYSTPRGPIGPDKARVLIAHTATVPPADVQVDGTTVFTNIANGEFADADVPAGDHRVAVLPTGSESDPILGPLTVTLEPRTVTMVYAVGSPTNGSMNVIAHGARIAADGSVVPETIDTGSAGLVASVDVAPFSSPVGRLSRLLAGMIRAGAGLGAGWVT